MSRRISRPPTPEPLLTAKDLAALLKIHDRTLRTWVVLGRVPEPLRIGGGKRLRWRPDVIRRWLDDGCPSETHK